MGVAEDFFRKLAPYAQEAQRRTGIPASVSLAQAALESGFGRSGLAKTANNLFGIKAGRSWKGKTVTLPTREWVNGQWVTVDAVWRAYDTPLEAFLDHGRLFYNGLYDAALPYRSSPEEFVKRIAPIYATDPKYADKLLTIIRRYALTQYDLPPSQWALDPAIVPAKWYQAWAKAVGKDKGQA